MHFQLCLMDLFWSLICSFHVDLAIQLFLRCILVFCPVLLMLFQLRWMNLFWSFICSFHVDLDSGLWFKFCRSKFILSWTNHVQIIIRMRSAAFIDHDNCQFLLAPLHTTCVCVTMILKFIACEPTESARETDGTDQMFKDKKDFLQCLVFCFSHIAFPNVILPCMVIIIWNVIYLHYILDRLNRSLPFGFHLTYLTHLTHNGHYSKCAIAARNLRVRSTRVVSLWQECRRQSVANSRCHACRVSSAAVLPLLRQGINCSLHLPKVPT